MKDIRNNVKCKMKKSKVDSNLRFTTEDCGPMTPDSGLSTPNYQLIWTSKYYSLS